MGPAPEDRLPKDATAGRVLTGALSLAKLASAAGSGDAPGAPAFSYLVRPESEDSRSPHSRSRMSIWHCLKTIKVPMFQ